MKRSRRISPSHWDTITLVRGDRWGSRLHTDISYLNTNTADISYLNANTADISHLNSQNACIEVYVTRALVLGVTVKICVELDESANIEAIVLNLYNVTLSSSKFNSGQVEDHRILRDMDLTPLKTTFF